MQPASFNSLDLLIIAWREMNSYCISLVAKKDL